MLARPKTTLEVQHIDNMQYIRVTPNMGMFFPGIVTLREMVTKEMLRTEFKVPVVIDCKNFTGLDYTASQVIMKTLLRLFLI